MDSEPRNPPAGGEPRTGDERPTLRRELKGLLLLYVVFALFSCLVAYQCAGP